MSSKKPDEFEWVSIDNDFERLAFGVGNAKLKQQGFPMGESVPVPLDHHARNLETHKYPDGTEEIEDTSDDSKPGAWLAIDTGLVDVRRWR